MNYKYIQNPLGMAGLYLAFGHAGAVSERDGKYGTSHLMEHMILKNIKPMRDILQANGISTNGTTSTDRVFTEMTGLADRVEKFASEYIERMLGSIDAITEKDFLNERKTVLQEYADDYADPLHAALCNAMRKHFGCYLAIGRRSDIENFTFEDYKESYAEIFSKPDLILYIGPDDPQPAIPEYSPVHVETNQYHYVEDSGAPLEKNVITNRAQIVVFPKELVGQADGTAASVALKMLSYDLNSPLMTEAREKRGMTYGMFGFINQIGDKAMPIIATATDRECKQELIDIIMEVLSNPSKYLTEERFETVKGMMLAWKKEETILLYQNPRAHINDSLGFINDRNGIETITYDHALAAAKKFFSPDSVGVYVE